MKIRYSDSERTFYPYDLDYANLPADVRDVPIEAHHAAMNRPAGATFTIDAGGNCVITEAPAPSFADVRAAAIRTIDADVDAIYAAVIGNRQAEYDLAEKDAQAYKAAGYTGTVPASVQAWADAKKQTAKWAADDILATSANWRTLQADIRAYRLGRKEDARNATDVAGVDAVMTTWAEYVARTRTALGV